MTTTLIGLQTCSWVDLTGLTTTTEFSALEGVAGAAATGASVTALTTRVTATEGVANAAAKQSDHTTLAGRVTATETKANAAATAASV